MLVSAQVTLNVRRHTTSVIAVNLWNITMVKKIVDSVLFVGITLIALWCGIVLFEIIVK